MCDPIAGFTDTVLGYLGLCLGHGTGALRTLYLADPLNRLNAIPADCAINSILVVARESLKSDCNPKIFNSVSLESCLPTFSEFIKLHTLKTFSLTFSFLVELNAEIPKLSSKFPYRTAIWIPHTTITTSKFVFRLLFLLYHFVPAFFIDIILYLKGSKISAMKIYSKVYYHLGLYEYFMGRNWKFPDENMQKVYSAMSDKDHESFPTQIVNREEAERYTVNSYHGVRKYLLKESEDDMIAARRKHLAFKIVHHLFWWTVYCGFAYYSFSKVKNVFNDVRHISEWIQI